MLTLHVEQRDTKQKPETMRKEGKLPAVFYGRKEKSTPITVDQHDFEKVFREAGEFTIIVLEGVGEEKEALIHEVDVHPVSGVPQHADFYVIEKGKKLNVDVPIEFVGTPPAVEDLGGVLVKVIHELEIEALPKDLPHEIMVDVSGLSDFESQITIDDLTLPEGVTAILDDEEVVAMISEPKEEEEEEEETEIDMDAIAVEGKEGKEGEDETSEEGDEEEGKGTQAEEEEA